MHPSVWLVQDLRDYETLVEEAAERDWGPRSCCLQHFAPTTHDADLFELTLIEEQHLAYWAFGSFIMGHSIFQTMAHLIEHQVWKMSQHFQITNKESQGAPCRIHNTCSEKGGLHKLLSSLSETSSTALLNPLCLMRLRTFCPYPIQTQLENVGRVSDQIIFNSARFETSL